MNQSSYRVPISVATGSFWPETTLQSITLLRQMGLPDIELTLQANEFRLGFDRSFDIPILFKLTEWVENDQLSVHSVHAPNMDTGNGYSLRARLDYLLQTLDIGYSLGAQVIVLHPFHMFTTHEAATAWLKGDSPQLDQALLPGFRDLLDQAQEWNLVLSLENIKMWEDDERDYFNHPDHLLLLLDQLAHPAMGITLDVMHAQCGGYLLEFTERLTDHIVNLHLADVEPPMERVPIGDGIIEWPGMIPLIDRLPNLRQVTIELSRATTGDVVRSVRTLSDLFFEYGE